MEHVETDILILGSGGAGLFAAHHAADVSPKLKIIMAAKGLIGKSGCTRMVQGGYNAVLHPDDSLDKHFTDTIKGGAGINNQDLAWVLVEDAPKRILELENKMGCFFDRNEDGTIHQKPFAGQSFDRTVHRGDLTGIEITSRLRDQLFAKANVATWDEVRALELLVDVDSGCIAGCLMLDIRSGELLVVRSKAVIVGTGGAATMYRMATPSMEKSGDGMAMCYRAGAVFLDMEMMQFHPTGLLAENSRLNGGVLEEGLRGAGGYLYNALGERFMNRYDPERMERSTRDRVSRACYMEIMAGRGTPLGGVYIDVSHLGRENVLKMFPGMVERCKDVGRDLSTEPVEISPSAHYHMGGVQITINCETHLPGLFVAGEDAGGVHGANRLGGNGVADSIVFGARAGDAAADYVLNLNKTARVWAGQVRDTEKEVLSSFNRKNGENPFKLKHQLKDLMWTKVGLVRTKKDLQDAQRELLELEERVRRISIRGPRAYNLAWQEALNVQNLITIAKMVTTSALLRTESRGSHYREDFPEMDDQNWLKNIFVQQGDDGEPRYEIREVKQNRMRIGNGEYIIE
ncbi:succinate dehydrogenase / fumarate reductase flavoprotein subunit/fumarate reductase flavoprotein subunit [Caldalkalibacillus uzonensis]|uniref:Succinate dehydrogenase / fumarate reductase flavoprotein subunit/fumarate reductase flavoprotein subunit n=1 Tax=Caldalkalibacillus uzonensis TaxID=353224 RepID=A0ABU0CNH2_9BACI|nr:FAD-binding protein [Caldalkalibacillus uzonensis]MDQ0337963.1 succinate dehydrogenase / fumarate reductase flavoprotein subunit/fumarate reductase flavoprotein subunit [Caldalkalibacillus uzonensis]